MLREYNATPPEILANEALLELLLPGLRADFALAENYESKWPSLRGVVAHLFHGADDDIMEAELSAWQQPVPNARWHLYDFYTPNKCPSSGFNPGISLSANVASGSGSWTGPFMQTDASATVLAAGYFQTPDTGYVGGQLGFSAGTPAGIGQATAVYKVVW